MEQTHPEDCWKWHHECAKAKIERMLDAQTDEFEAWWARNDHPFFLKIEAEIYWYSSRASLVERIEYLESELAG